MARPIISLITKLITVLIKQKYGQFTKTTIIKCAKKF